VDQLRGAFLADPQAAGLGDAADMDRQDVGGGDGRRGSGAGPRLAVTGASGQLGRGIVEKLLERVPAGRIGVSVRDPEKARDLEKQGVRVRHGDFGDAGTLADAFEGASQVLIVSANDTGGAAVRAHRTAIDVAQAAGARRILYTSHMGSSRASLFAPMVDHAATEAALQDSGVAFTSLRNGFYVTTVLRLLGAALETGVLAAPADGPVSWTAHPDLAEAAAIVLGDGGLDGVTPALTGSEAVDLDGVAAIVSGLAGRPVRRVVVADAEYRASLTARGVPEAAAGMLVGMFAASRQGEFAQVDPALRRLIGRPPMTVREFLTAALSPPG
jgi:NAD(P)H dehydrogenase (quinone)